MCACVCMHGVRVCVCVCRVGVEHQYLSGSIHFGGTLFREHPHTGVYTYVRMCVCVCVYVSNYVYMYLRRPVTVPG